LNFERAEQSLNAVFCPLLFIPIDELNELVQLFINFLHYYVEKLLKFDRIRVIYKIKKKDAKG